VRLRLRLLSDFSDYYDHWFDSGAGCANLRRYSTDGVGRFEQLYFMGRAGIKVPAYGVVRSLLGDVPRYGAPEAEPHRVSKRATKLVVYTDDMAHCGEGKVLVSLDEAMERYPDNVATEYIEGCPGVSWRYLQVGVHCFWIEYKSRDDWRSNCGDVKMQVVGEGTGWGSLPRLPLFAIDYVIGDELYAVDFNVAPGVRGTGVERILSPKQAAESIVEAYHVGEYARHADYLYRPNPSTDFMAVN
jgi:hypothetical protein